MRKFLLVLALAAPVLTRPASASEPYRFVQASVDFNAPPPGAKTLSLRIHLLDTGGTASSCVVKVGRVKKKTGVSANGAAVVYFDSLTNYKRYTVTCSVN